MPDLRTKAKIKSIVTLFATIAVGITLNIVAAKLNGLTGSPLFLDIIGTALTALVGGYIPCITVGFFTNIILGIGDPDTMYFCIISVLIAAAAVFCTKKRLISLFLGFLLLVRTYSVWLTQKHIVKPMNRISEAVHRFSYDTPEAREKSMKMIEDLDIRSGDEIANLYRAYKKTTSDMVRYIDEVQHREGAGHHP